MCIEAAIQVRPDMENVRTINLRSVTEPGMKVADVVGKVVEFAEGFEPQAVCLTIGGNLHNMLGIIENPIPFSVGAAEKGSVPEGVNDRLFIPSAVMDDVFKTQFDSRRMAELYRAFPGALRLYLNSPPPIPDFDHIRKYPGIFRDKIFMGPAPNDLRMKLYQMQSKAIRALTDAQGAIFVDPAPELLDAGGFLRSDYFNTDPTHGNIAYGQVMLDELLKITEREL